jgi:hypothetical protein
LEKLIARLSSGFRRFIELSVQQPKGGKPVKILAAKARKPLWKFKREIMSGKSSAAAKVATN